MTLTSDLHHRARRLFDTAIAAADPAAATTTALETANLPCPKGRRVLLAVGKAAIPMMRASFAYFGKTDQALSITNRENAAEIDGAEVLIADHPVPAAGSAAAGQAALNLAGSLTKDDQLICLISGGGSALMTAPIAGISDADKAAANAVLLASGFDITTMNLIRQQLSQLKGGGLSRAAQPAQVHAFILSDVIGDDLRAIASGPTASPLGTRARAREALSQANLFKNMPESVQLALAKTDEAAEKHTTAQNQIIGSNRISLAAMEAQGGTLVDPMLTGDVADAAQKIIRYAQDYSGPCTLIMGGETTVTLRGNGLGGRNQELALRIAMAADQLGENWVFLSGGTDGRDGPTEAAGGIVDAHTKSRILAAGGDPAALLANNDSNAALALAGDLLITGGTGTNVADVQVFIRGK